MPSISVEELERAGWVRGSKISGDWFYSHPSEPGVWVDDYDGELYAPGLPSRFVSSFAELDSLYPAFSRKFVHGPEVRCIAETNDPGYLPEDFVREFGIQNPRYDSVCEAAGRVCYMSFDSRRPGGHDAYIENILKQQHGSVLEHVSATFLIWGISRNLTHEFVRHRAGWAYSQLSQRYATNVRFVVHPDLEESDIREECTTAYRKYRELLIREGGKKQVRSAARNVLPGCTETILTATCNARALRHFLEKRAAPGADKEIQNLAVALWTEAKNTVLYPYVKDFAETEPGILTTPYPKV